MRKLFVMLFCSIIFCTFGQSRPGNNLGKSLNTMRQDFPELRYIRTDEKGDFYEDGYPEDGIAMFFYFRNNAVIEECMICESTDEFAKIWYNEMWKSFSSKYPYAVKENAYNSLVSLNLC